MSRGTRITLLLAAADADGVAQSQTPAGAADLTLNGALVTDGVGILATAGQRVGRRVLVTTVSDESGKTLTIYGTGPLGNSISESMTGPNATTGYTVQDFVTVTRVAVSAAFTGAVTVGTNGIGGTAWVPLDVNRIGAWWSLGVILGVTANVMPQGTLDPLYPDEQQWWMGQPTDSFWTPTPYDLQSSAMTATNLVTGQVPLRGVRLLVNSGASTGAGINFEVVQQGLQ